MKDGDEQKQAEGMFEKPSSFWPDTTPSLRGDEQKDSIRVIVGLKNVPFAVGLFVVSLAALLVQSWAGLYFYEIISLFYSY